MHKFIFPSSDTFICNDPDYYLKNFGRDEILEINAFTRNVVTFVVTGSSEISRDRLNLQVLSFSGYFSGSLTGSGDITSGSAFISGSGMWIEPDTGSC